MSQNASIPDLAARIAGQQFELKCKISELKSADSEGLWFAMSSAETQANEAAEFALSGIIGQFDRLIRIANDAIKAAEKTTKRGKA
ncbi:hypothetical protein [Mesoterricola silvestris]|uniref:Uncharacterized protein n=1 Tax=Mesoterricola silvestris TaxID=2927979 RepID=A0AA48KBB9_9BACT|nr:hypothetical protein [Mesoterricola silvestris]BDU72368.1 hypothetical protein METEAL_15420 [Mesoterricola silvestris]